MPRSYAGAAIAAPGLASDFSLRPHQHQAIARLLFGGNTALWHPVGAGKTAEMVVAGMEMRRLGIISRPAFVVPDHMLGQFSGDFLRLYPAGEILTVEKDAIGAAARHLFAARTASHDWDAVIITHSSFVRWPVSRAVEEAILADKIAERRTALAELGRAEGAARTLTKRLEKAIARYEADMVTLNAKVAHTVTPTSFPSTPRASTTYLSTNRTSSRTASSTRSPGTSGGCRPATARSARSTWMQSSATYEVRTPSAR